MGSSTTELRKQLEELQSRQKSNKDTSPVSNRLRAKRSTLIGWLIFAIIFISASILIGLLNNSNPTFTTYTSPDGRWSADFPGTPEEQTNTKDISGVSVPFTQYSSSYNADSTAYLIQVVDYPSDFDLSQASSSEELDDAISGMVGASGYSLISKSDLETFQGYPAKEASFNVQQDNKNYTLYAMNFIKSNTLYTIATIGETTDGYNHFLNTFQQL